MFSKKHGKSHGHGRPKKESNSKKHHIRTWIHTTKKKKNEANLFTWVLSDIYSHSLKSYATSRGSRAYHRIINW